MNKLTPEEKLAVRSRIKHYKDAQKRYVIFDAEDVSCDILAHIQERNLGSPEYIISERKLEDKSLMVCKAKKIKEAKREDFDEILLAANDSGDDALKAIQKQFPSTPVFSFSHLRKELKAKSKLNSMKDNEKTLGMIWSIVQHHGNYAVYENEQLALALAKLTSAYNIKKPACLFKRNPKIKQLGGVPIAKLSNPSSKSIGAVIYCADKYCKSELLEKLKNEFGPQTVFFNIKESLSKYQISPDNLSELPFVINRTATLGITRKCNLRCVYCMHTGSRAAETGEIPFSKIKKILKQLEGSCSTVILNELGEPLLHKDILNIIREAKKIIPRVTFATNGLALSQEMSLGLASAGLSDITLSLDSLDAEYNKKVRGINTEKIISNLESFSKFTALPVSINAVITNENIKSFSDIPRLKLRIPTLKTVKVTPLCSVTSESLNECSLKKAPTGNELDRHLISFKSACMEFNVTARIAFPRNSTNLAAKNQACKRPWQIYINVNGNMIPCCCDVERETYVYANAYTDNIINEFAGAKMKDFRGAVLSGENKLCKQCDFAL